MINWNVLIKDIINYFKTFFSNIFLSRFYVISPHGHFVKLKENIKPKKEDVVD